MPSSGSAAGYSTGRVTPRKGASPASAPSKARALARELTSNEKWDVDQSKHVRSGWIWRAFFMLSLIAVGVAIIMFGNHYSTLGILWLVIAGGWFATSMWLWRKHTLWINSSE